MESPRRSSPRRLQLDALKNEDEQISKVLLKAIATLTPNRGLRQLGIQLGSRNAHCFCSVSQQVAKDPLGFTVFVNQFPEIPIPLRDGCVSWEFHVALMYTLISEDLLTDPDLWVQQYGNTPDQKISATDLITKLVDAQEKNPGAVSIGAEACIASDTHWKLAEALTAYAFEYAPTWNGHAHNPFHDLPLLYIACNRYYNASIRPN